VATLSAYISYARHMVQPQLSDTAADDLVNAYVDLRSRGMGRKVREGQAHTCSGLREAL